MKLTKKQIIGLILSLSISALAVVAWWGFLRTPASESFEESLAADAPAQGVVPSKPPITLPASQGEARNDGNGPIREGDRLNETVGIDATSSSGKAQPETAASVDESAAAGAPVAPTPSGEAPQAEVGAGEKASVKVSDKPAIAPGDSSEKSASNTPSPENPLPHEDVPRNGARTSDATEKKDAYWAMSKDELMKLLVQNSQDLAAETVRLEKISKDLEAASNPGEVARLRAEKKLRLAKVETLRNTLSAIQSGAEHLAIGQADVNPDAPLVTRIESKSPAYDRSDVKGSGLLRGMKIDETCHEKGRPVYVSRGGWIIRALQRQLDALALEMAKVERTRDIMPDWYEAGRTFAMVSMLIATDDASERMEQAIARAISAHREAVMTLRLHWPERSQEVEKIFAEYKDTTYFKNISKDMMMIPAGSLADVKYKEFSKAIRQTNEESASSLPFFGK